MPTNRTHTKRHRVTAGLLPEERQWLTGEKVEGAGALWSFRGGREKAERCRFLLRHYASLIPRGRMAQLKRDIERWEDRPLRGLASFRK